MLDRCSGFVRGEDGRSADLLAFKPEFPEGALLTVVSTGCTHTHTRTHRYARTHMWSDLRTTHLLSVGNSPHQAVEVPVRSGSQIKICDHCPDDPGVCLCQTLCSSLNFQFTDYILSQKGEKVNFFCCDCLRCWSIGGHI